MSWNKTKLFFTFLFFLFMISEIICVYRQEAYKYFDKFNFVDLVI